jgi:6-pyruvoyltetrahydropterin/6-carboxytetrahydropterin synthase
MITIKREFSFAGAHKLPCYDGKCANLHGHEWKLFVEITGEICKDPNNPKIGMIMDFGDLKKLVEKEIIEKLDHQYLNEKVAIYPTAEFLIILIRDILQEALPEGIRLVSLELFENAKSSARWS